MSRAGFGSIYAKARAKREDCLAWSLWKDKVKQSIFFYDWNMLHKIIFNEKHLDLVMSKDFRRTKTCSVHYMAGLLKLNV